MKIKTNLIGPGKMDKQMVFLGRVLSWEDGVGVRYECDPRHAEIILQQMFMEQAKSATTPGTPGVHELRDESESNPLVLGSAASLYRGIVARLNFMSLDRPDLQYASKEASRYMATPRAKDWDLIKRICQYLRHRPRATFMYAFQSEPTEFTIFSDTDWAGDTKTRKSTSGGVI